MFIATRSRRSALRSASLVGLACLVLAAETFAAWHDADLTAHSTNAPCKICLSISGVTNANVGETIVVALPAPPLRCNPLTPIVVTAALVTPKLARGPPFAV
jgi:predicted ribosomally synthesized peptide with SipW-like signal peptide